MKRLITLILAVLLLFASVPALAGADLSAMSLEELIELQDSIDLSGMSIAQLAALNDRFNLLLWKSQAWQQVTVPPGIYIVGEDILAGHWTIRPTEGERLYIKWGDGMDESGRDIYIFGDIHISEALFSESYDTYRYGLMTEVDFNLKDGHCIVIEDSEAVFTPYAGKPPLDFK